MAATLASFKILIADSDQHLSHITKLMLKGMGFNNIHITPSGKTALELVKTGNFDFVITEWHLKDMDGVNLITRIRRDSDSPNPTLPVIMLTGRMEQSDVQTARDHGIHEYVIKPFSAQTIYNRLERIVDFPRHFVVGGEFVGPDRRHKKVAPPATDRRAKPLVPERKPWNAREAIHDDNGPKLWLPDFSLKHKLGGEVKLESIITPAVLNQAQAVINSASEESLQWVRKDLNDLRALMDTLGTNRDPNLLNEVIEVTLAISSRSGTFGFTRASEVAYSLYLFMRRHFKPANPHHIKAIDKHLEVLDFIFTNNIRGDEGDIVLVVKELKNLTEKYVRAAA